MRGPALILRLGSWLAAAVLTFGIAVAYAQHAPSPGKSAVPGADAPRLYGNVGTHHRGISTRSLAAQHYFDQGLRLKYAFNVEEAQVSFEEAVKRDPSCGMCWWGVALSLGSDINIPRIPDRDQAAYEAVQKALSLASRASSVERALIEALAKRYASPAPTDPARQHELDQAYADAMRRVYRRFPNDDDVATLYAESLMDLRPWHLWTLEGRPEPGTTEIVDVLERVLRRNAGHVGANHFYVHAIEASPHPEKAVPSADRLKYLAPGAGHLVHMPAHIYQRVGRYAESEEANRKGVAADQAYFAATKREGHMYVIYLCHNYHFLAFAAMQQGRSTQALQAARSAATTAPVDMIRQMPGMDFFFTPHLTTMVRFSRWDDILKEPAGPAGFPFVSGLRHWARGRAFTAKGQLKSAFQERDSLAKIAGVTPPDAPEGYNTAKNLLAIALHSLEGAIAARRGEHETAIRHLEEAVEAEDKLSYDEPPDWMIPNRHQLGEALLAAGRPAEAEAVYDEDLRRHPENGWALFGLAQALRAQGKTREASGVEARFRRAWSRSDTKLAAARF